MITDQDVSSEAYALVMMLIISAAIVSPLVRGMISIAHVLTCGFSRGATHPETRVPVDLSPRNWPRRTAKIDSSHRQ